MNALLSPQSVRWLVIVLLSFGLVPVFASTLFAATADANVGAFLQANTFFELVSDRARLIQISLVFVALGCALIWWYR
jgi:hypothetical protein